MANHSETPGKSQTSDFDRFTNFIRLLIAVPHLEIKAQLEAERTSKPSASRASAPPAQTGKLERSARFSHLAGLFCIGKAFACDPRHCQHKPVRIVQRVFFHSPVIQKDPLKASSDRTILDCDFTVLSYD